MGKLKTILEYSNTYNFVFHEMEHFEGILKSVSLSFKNLNSFIMKTYFLQLEKCFKA